jgi:D-amino-acid dehydrogenase
MSRDSDQVVVIGGGVIGAMCAWYLAQADRAVTLVDRGRFGGACSHGNCGYISPSHVLPLTAPGAVGKILRSMLSRRSPFYVKPRFSPALWRWLWNFSRRCNRRDMLSAGSALHQLLERSKGLYVDLIESQRLDCEFEKVGLLFVYRDAHEFHEFERTNELTRREFGVAAEPIDAARLSEIEPALKPGLGGAWYYPCDSHLRPDRLMAELKRLLTERGVTIVENCGCVGLVVDANLARAARTDQGEIGGQHFVVATGAWTPQWNQWLGCHVPIQPGKGYSITMPRPSICPRYPLIFEQHRVAITPLASCYRIGSTMEFAGYDSSINERRLKLLTDSAAIYLREPTCEPVIERWYGWRPMTWDSLPFIGRAPLARNVWVAAGHNMLGLSTATATGELIADLIAGAAPQIDAQPFALERILA